MSKTETLKLIFVSNFESFPLQIKRDRTLGGGVLITTLYTHLISVHFDSIFNFESI